jgi:hypothetical protein
MQRRKGIDMSEEEEGGIFVNEAEVIDGQRKAAEAVGINPDLVAPEDGSEPSKLVAKKSCNRCWGKGVITMIPSPQKVKLFWVTKSPTGKVTKRVKRRTANGKKKLSKPFVSKRGATKERNRIIIGYGPDRKDLRDLWDDRELSEGSEKFRGTSRPEPLDYKEKAVQNFLCGCVKQDEVA